MLPKRERSKIEKFLFEEAETYENLKQVPSIGKLQGYHNFYKIRFGNYKQEAFRTLLARGTCQVLFEREENLSSKKNC